MYKFIQISVILIFPVELVFPIPGNPNVKSTSWCHGKAKKQSNLQFSKIMRIQILSLILGLGSLIGAPAFAQNVQVQSEQRPQMDSMGFQTNFGDFGTKSEYRNGSGAEIVDTQNNTQLRTSGQMNSAYGTPDGNVLPAVSGTGTYLQNNDSIQADQFGLEQSAADPTAPSVDPLELRQPPAAPVPVQINQP